MSEKYTTFEEKLDSHRKVASNHLKSCPVCNAINASDNLQCFVCSWSGKFNEDPTIIKIGLDQLIDRCPELADELGSGEKKSPKREVGLSRLFKALFRKPLDISA